MKIKSIKFVILVCLIIFVTSCANTPNDVVMTVNQGSCVQSSMYLAQGFTPPTSVWNNPESAPYCMSVTLTNNNSGQNANNVQIVNSGMVLSYSVGANSYSSMIYDPVSAGLSISGANQIVGNVITYDPNKCTTTTGANVITLNQNGGSCTFFIQLSGESFPVGVYNTNITYNYTNGNQNYSTGINFNQRVNLYAGGTGGIFLDTNGSWQNFISPTISGVNAITTDLWGHVYISTLTAVSLYNGISGLNTLGSFPSGYQITSLATDNNGAIYAGTNGGGVYKYNPYITSPVWESFNGSGISSTSNIIGLSNFINLNNSGTDALFATTATTAYQCNSPESFNNSCTWVTLTSSQAPESFNAAAITTDNYGVLYTGSGSSVNSYALTSWYPPYVFNPTIIGEVSSLVWSNFESVQNLFVGQVPITGLESSVYSCALTGTGTPTTCIPTISESGNSLYGSIYGIDLDGANNLYVVGGGILSSDFTESSPILAAYIGEGATGATSNWTPIQNGVVTNSTLSVVKSASILTSY